MRAKRASEAAAGDDAAGAATGTGPGPADPKDGGEEDGGAAGAKEPEAERWRAEEPAAEPSRGASDASKSLVAEPSLVAARVDPGGVVGPSIRVAAVSSARRSGMPRAVTLSDGRVLLAWTDLFGDTTRVRTARVELPRP